MKYQKALLCIALAGTLIFSGCGSTNNSTGNNTNTSSSVESTVETSTEDTDAKSDENTVTGMISEITDSTITVAAMPGGDQGEHRAIHRAITKVVPQQTTGTLTTAIQQRHLTNLTLMAQIPPKPLAIRLVETTILPLPTTAVPRI